MFFQSTLTIADEQYVIWEKGVGSTVSVGSSAELDRNKTEVLREFEGAAKVNRDNWS